jgi:hypothetical protein
MGIWGMCMVTLENQNSGHTRGPSMSDTQDGSDELPSWAMQADQRGRNLKGVDWHVHVRKGDTSRSLCGLGGLADVGADSWVEATDLDEKRICRDCAEKAGVDV